ncbi:MAG: tagaturonate epimerase family protein [Anaerolineae bacterium]|nr:tagaturonate epimerase family protein [Anaerolineae bacterium]
MTGVYPCSRVEVDGTAYSLARAADGRKVLIVRGNVQGFAGERQGEALVCPLTPANAAALRSRLPWLRPTLLGLQPSFGFGDRLGLATPGHVRALRGALCGSVAALRPCFAQQSVRENTRTGRTPQQVLDDAMWGLFQEGWRGPWGADADHLKTPEEADAFIAAGYTFYTVDPGEYVDNSATTAPPEAIAEKVRTLPWDELEDTPRDMELRYLERPLELENSVLAFDLPPLHRAAAKYGRAIAHTARMYRHLAARLGEGRFELEVSVDETETPTSPEEHLYIAGELKRLGVRWVSLAPRFVGRFEKGVDYLGDPEVFATEFARHVAIAQVMGPYKLSLHSGSDKFTVYPIIAQLGRGLVHVKTAGTSYLEALRTVAQVDPAFFRELLGCARMCYERDRVSYHVSAHLAHVPAPRSLDSVALLGLFEQFDARQVLHVTFGSVLERFGERLLATLRVYEEAYYAHLEAHLKRHLAALAGR